MPNPTRSLKTLPTGLFGWLETTRIALPLKGVEVHFDLQGDLLDVEIDQIYYQSHDRAMDVTYTFPLPDGAAVNRCEMHVNGRIICAKALPVSEATRLAKDFKAKGYRTALAEAVRENLFELGLGNLLPGDTVVIRFGYQQILDHEGLEASSFRIPLTPGIRYIPGNPLLRRNQGTGVSDDTDAVPDASRLNPPRISSLDQDAAYLSCIGKIDPAGWDLAKITSPSHALLVEEEENVCRIRLATHGEVPDRDLVVRLAPTRECVATQKGWVIRSAQQSYAAVRLIAPARTAEAPTTANDFFFLIDRSGSMSGANWNACAKALRALLQTLGPLDRAFVTFFESTFQDLAEKPLPAAAILAEPIIAQLENLGTGGGTELLPAIAHVLDTLDRHASPDRDPQLIILTDGQVGNEAQIHNLLAPRIGKLPVHTFGIDTAVNDAFLRRLAKDHGGTCSLTTPNDDMVALVAGIARRRGAPALRSLRLQDGWESSGATLPTLWEGDAVTILARASGSPTELVLQGETVRGETLTLRVALAPAKGCAPQVLWQRQQIRKLEREERNQEAVALACEANLLSEGTAFVAWDESEQVMISEPNLPIHQPSMLQASMAAPVFGLLQMSASAAILGSLGRGSVRFSKQLALAMPYRTRDPKDFEASPVISSPKPSGWTTQLPDLLGLAGSHVILFTDWLEQWLWMEPNRVDSRLALLNELVDRLTALPEVDRKNAFLKWVDATLDATIRHAVKRLL
jgi:Ca-activated chloride channel family protein